MPFLLSFSGGSHVTDNDDEFCAITVTFSGGPSGAENWMRWYGKLFLIKGYIVSCALSYNQSAIALVVWKR
jgi:hypothetical protein